MTAVPGHPESGTELRSPAQSVSALCDQCFGGPRQLHNTQEVARTPTRSQRGVSVHQLRSKLNGGHTADNPRGYTCVRVCATERGMVGRRSMCSVYARQDMGRGHTLLCDVLPSPIFLLQVRHNSNDCKTRQARQASSRARERGSSWPRIKHIQ